MLKVWPPIGRTRGDALDPRSSHEHSPDDASNRAGMVRVVQETIVFVVEDMRYRTIALVLGLTLGVPILIAIVWAIFR